MARLTPVDIHSDGVIFSHLTPDQKTSRLSGDQGDPVDVLERAMEECPVVVPLRHPASVAVSWKSRGKPLDVLYALWELLTERVHRFSPLYIPIDAPERRDARLQAVSEAISKQIETNWPVVGSCGIACKLSSEENRAISKYAEFYYGV